MNKNILYITTRLPYPVIGGDKLRMYNILKQLKLQGHNITLVSLVSSDDDIEAAKEHNEFYTTLITVPFNKNTAYLYAVQALFNDKPFIVQYYYSNKMQKIIDDLIKKEKFDVITGYMIRIAPYLEKHSKKNVIIDFVDAVSMMYERRVKTVTSIWDKFKINIEYNKVKNYEKKCTKLFKKQTVISQFDKEYISRFGNIENIEIIGNGVDVDYYIPQETKKNNNICFVGSMQYIPNAQAAIYFATEIFPMVKKEIPDAKFKIIGANPRKDLYEAVKDIEGIEITGRVEDVRAYMKDCCVSVCPVKIAGGIQNKILEAMSMGIPVVTTKEGAEGIYADNTILQVANSNEDYAQKVIELIRNKEKITAIGEASRNFVIDKFSWNSVGNDINKLINEVTNG